MAMTPWVARGTLSATLTTTLHTVTDPADAIVTNIVLTNKTANTVAVTIDFDTYYVLSGAEVPSYSTVTFDLKQPLITSGANKLIRGGAGSASSIDYHISGVYY